MDTSEHALVGKVLAHKRGMDTSEPALFDQELARVVDFCSYLTEFPDAFPAGCKLLEHYSLVYYSESQVRRAAPVKKQHTKKLTTHGKFLDRLMKVIEPLTEDAGVVSARNFSIKFVTLE